MGETAELLADKHNITRQQCDEFAILSQQRWKAGAPHIRRACARAHTRDMLNRKNTYNMERQWNRMESTRNDSLWKYNLQLRELPINREYLSLGIYSYLGSRFYSYLGSRHSIAAYAVREVEQYSNYVYFTVFSSWILLIVLSVRLFNHQ